MIRNHDLVQEILGGYRITAEHSSSAFSTTFLGESISPTAACQRVLIKVLSTTGIHTLHEQQNILQKISLLQQLQHPYILPIVSLGTHDDAPYIITEYIHAESLHGRLQKRPTGQGLKITDALRMLAQVGQTLYYAHEQQVVHGYLRPQIVLLTMQDEVLLTGFHRHILQLSDEATGTNPLDLSVYRAPEQVAGFANEKSDQYALGCIAYDLFTGCRAFMIPSVNKPGTYYRTKSLIAPEKLNPALPSYISDAILKAMSREPEQRHRDIAAFLTALRIPLTRGTGDLKKTILLPEITLEAPDMPITPMPDNIVRETAQKSIPIDVITTKDEKHTDIDILSQLLSGVIEPVEPHAPSKVLLDVSSGYMSRADEITFKIHSSDGIVSQPFLQKAEKRSRPNSRLSLIIVMGLIACIMLLTTMLIALSVAISPKAARTSPVVYKTVVVSSLTPTVVPTASVVARPSSPAAPPDTSNASQGQGTLPAPIPTSNNGTSGFLQGVSSINTSEAQFWFTPNGWTASNMILHYAGTGQAQQNLQMLYNNNASQWQYVVSSLSSAQTIVYWFSYQQNSIQYTSGTYTYITSTVAPTPVPPKPNPTPTNCASSHSEGARSINSSQGLFWFSSCGWMAGYVILHYTGTGQAQQNLQMFYNNSGIGQWQYTVSGLNTQMTLTYWFSYQQNGTQYDTATYTWAHPGR